MGWGKIGAVNAHSARIPENEMPIFRIGSDIRATVLSVAMMAGSLAYVVLAPLFGRFVDTSSLGRAFLVLGACFLAGMTLVLVSLSRRHPGVFDTKGNNRKAAGDNPAGRSGRFPALSSRS